jgi:predicted O-methyltransferase YrrM
MNLQIAISAKIAYICFVEKARFILKYLNYLLTAKTRYSVHPPFLFDLVSLVFNDHNKYPEYATVEKIRKELLTDQEFIKVNDLGAGSAYFKNPERKISDIAKTSSKLEKHVQLIYRMVKHLKPEVILELGTSLGITTSYMAMAQAQSQITTIEGCENIGAIAQRNFDKIKAKNIELIIGAFDDELEAILKQKNKIDLVFIDGNHSKEPTIKYFDQLLNNIHSDSVMIFDDIHWSEGMEAAWEHIKNHPEVKLTIDIFFMGFVFFKKDLTKEHFVIRY